MHRLNPKKVTFQHQPISDFVTPRSINLFEALRLPLGFLTAGVETWEERGDFKTASTTVIRLTRTDIAALRDLLMASVWDDNW